MMRVLPTDEELCLLAQGGDNSARDKLVARYLDLVGFRARGYLPDLVTVGIEADDLGQEGFLGLLSAIQGFDPSYGAKFRTFATLAIDRRMTDAVRAAFRKKQVPSAAKVELGDEVSLGENPEHTAIVRDELNRVMARMESTSSLKERRALAMHLDGYSYLEIAQQLGCSAKSVENALSRVRRKLSDS